MAASDKWITDGIHPSGQTGPVDNRIRDRLPTRITKKFRLTEKSESKDRETDGDEIKAFKFLVDKVGQNNQAQVHSW